MKIKVTYKVGKFNFEFTADSISQAYEIAKELVDRNRRVFTNKSDTLDFLMVELVKMHNNTTIKYENAFFGIEKMGDGK